ncbi:c-type cytochrome [Paraburkholderia humisilvae]|nr:c-type cytochrome [Paraburkholderia humisilvae]
MTSENIGLGTTVGRGIVALMCATTALLLQPDGAFAQEVGEPAAEVARSGSASGIPACSACHGSAGEGNPAVGYPRLAGLPALYLEQQLTELADGTRNNPMMSPIAKLLSTGDRTALAGFYASMPAPQTPNSPSAAKTRNDVGERIALRGNWAEGVPACVSCHGSNGSGVGDVFPPLAGQSAIYIRNQISAWKYGKRAPGPLGLMSTIARKLSDAEAVGVADYFAAQSPVAKGETP